MQMLKGKKTKRKSYIYRLFYKYRRVKWDSVISDYGSKPNATKKNMYRSKPQCLSYFSHRASMRGL